MPRLKKQPVRNGVLVDETTRSLSLVENAVENILEPAQVDLRRLIDQAVSEEDWISMFRGLKLLAVGDNDKRAAELLMKYRFGLPPQMVQHGGKVAAGIKIVEVIRHVKGESSDNEIVDGEAQEFLEEEPIDPTIDIDLENLNADQEPL